MARGLFEVQQSFLNPNSTHQNIYTLPVQASKKSSSLLKIPICHLKKHVEEDIKTNANVRLVWPVD